MAQMEHFHVQGHGSDRPDVDFPQSQELFSDEEWAENDTGRNNIIPDESDTSTQNDKNLFQDQIVSTPTRTRRTRGCKKLKSPPIVSNDSSDYELPRRKLTLKEIFDNNFRKKRKRKYKKRRNLYTERKQPQKDHTKVRLCYTIPLEQRIRRLRHCGIRFPFASKKHLSLKQCFAYEQYVLGGFLNNIKKRKCENHLQKGLMNMEVDKDLEEGSIESRKFKYMDDEAPLSPISESGENSENETEYCDAEIVENSSFILDCIIPSKEQWKKKRQGSKAND